MKTPTYDELLAVVKEIAGLIYDGDRLAEPNANGLNYHEMSIDDAFDTCATCRDLCRGVLGTDGSELPPKTPEQIETQLQAMRDALINDPKVRIGSAVMRDYRAEKK
jgi:hypothetical protein